MKTATLQPRLAVQTMSEYHPPLAGRNGIRLDFNENTFGPSPLVLKRLQSLTAEDLMKYPEREPVEQLVAQHFNLGPDQVLLTNGVDEAIHLLIHAYIGPSDEAIIVVPTFSMYEINVQACAGTVHRIQSPPELTCPIAEVLAAITPQTRLIVIASPNNPTGAIVSRENILEVAAAAPYAAVLADEAYYHFHGETVLRDVDAIPNLFVVRTFSKVYGLAGLRVGFIAGDTGALQFVRKVGSPYNVNAVALACLPTALGDESYVRWYTEQINIGRDLLQDALVELSVPHWPSRANFILTRIGDQHRQFVQGMRRRGVLVRDRSSDPGLDGCVRISIGTVEHTQAGIAAVRETLKEVQWQPPK